MNTKQTKSLFGSMIIKFGLAYLLICVVATIIMMRSQYMLFEMTMERTLPITFEERVTNKQACLDDREFDNLTSAYLVERFVIDGSVMSISNILEPTTSHAYVFMMNRDTGEIVADSASSMALLLKQEDLENAPENLQITDPEVSSTTFQCPISYFEEAYQKARVSQIAEPEGRIGEIISECETFRELLTNENNLKLDIQDAYINEDHYFLPGKVVVVWNPNTDVPNGGETPKSVILNMAPEKTTGYFRIDNIKPLNTQSLSKLFYPVEMLGEQCNRYLPDEAFKEEAKEAFQKLDPDSMMNQDISTSGGFIVPKYLNMVMQDSVKDKEGNTYIICEYYQIGNMTAYIWSNYYIKLILIYGVTLIVFGTVFVILYGKKKAQ